MIPIELLKTMTLEDRFKYLSLGISEGIKHLDNLYGDFHENIEAMDKDSKEFMHGYTAGLLEALQLLLFGDEEE